MKRKRLTAVLAAVLAFSLAACGGSAASAANSGEAVVSSGGDYDLRLVNGKVEVDEQLKELAAAYEAETGVRVQIESMGGGVDIQGTLKGNYQADNMPDIFVNGGARDFANWEGLLADLGDEVWAADTDAAYIDAEGRVLGFPYTIEAIGLAYNADILEKAGIDPAAITGPETMRSAFETLDAKKDELGLTAVIGYCAEAMNLYWSTGDHLFGVYEDAGLERDDTTYLDLLSDGGKIDPVRFKKYAEMIALFNRYSDPALLALFGSMAAWVISRNNKKVWAAVIYMIFIASMIIPFQVVMLPLISTFRDVGKFAGIGMLQSIPGIVFAYCGFGGAMTVFILTGFIKGIPYELEEAAAIDGCSPEGTFFLVIIPLLRPVITTVSILNGMWIWNDYLLPSLMLGQNGRVKTLPVAVQAFVGSYVKQWDLILTAALLAIIPMVVFFAAAQKWIMSGMVEGAVKG